MNAVGFAWRSLRRQPARATLGVLGVAAVGALLLDMLLLSQGLVVSMRDLFNRSGWDIRVTAGELPGRGMRLGNALSTAERIAALPSVRAALIVRLADARIERGTGRPIDAAFQGIRGFSRGGTPITPPWTITGGRESTGTDEVVIDSAIAAAANLKVGSSITLRGGIVATGLGRRQ